MTQQKADVIISGGGLAGLSLALQLVNAQPTIKIIIVEKNTFPVPPTTAKVGESTVEIGSHYLREVLGLADHLDKHHLRKFGLRCFFGTPQLDFALQDELGVSQLFNMPSYQIERGTLENHLHQLLLEKGVQIIDGARTVDITLQPLSHTVTTEQHGEVTHHHGRWYIDAAGRAGLLKKKLGLQQESPHKGNAVYFRINKKILLDQWSEQPWWHDRIVERDKRWLSTNHLMGPGYWVWVIPLASGATSIGIVFDDHLHANIDISSFAKCEQWLNLNQPKCAEQIRGAELLDFHTVTDYAYSCSQYFSEEGWAVCGEAGAFIDPFYSPGSDFIAINNTLVNELILQDLAGQDIRLNTLIFHTFYRSFVEHTLSLYLNQYGGFGDRQLMSIKLVWDYSYYWGVLAVMFMKGAITDVTVMRKINPYLQRAHELNSMMQNATTQRAQLRLQLPTNGVFLDQHKIPCLLEFTKALSSDCPLTIDEALAKNVSIMDVLVPAFLDMLSDQPNRVISAQEQDILGNYRWSVLR